MLLLNEGIGIYNWEYNVMQKLQNLLSHKEEDDELFKYTLYIPRAYARGETKKSISFEDFEKGKETVECYELYIVKQVGSYRSRKDAFLFWKVPDTDRIVRVRLYMDGGANFEKEDHTFILRNTDKMDRDIIIGFCKKHFASLINAIYDSNDSPYYLKRYAFWYKRTDSPKRINYGSDGNDFTNSYKNNLMPYDESNIFKNVVFI